MKKIDYSKLKAQPENEDFAGKYESKSIVAKYLVDKYYKSVFELLNLTQNVEFAHEVGVGMGYSSKILKDRFRKFTASEFVDEMALHAQTLNPDIHVFQESVYELKYEENKVDLILLLEVLEHLDFPKLALKELSRVSKRYAIIGVPNEPLWRILNCCRLKYLNRLGNTPGHINHWSKQTLIKLLEEEFGKVIAVKSPIPWNIVLVEKY